MIFLLSLTASCGKQTKRTGYFLRHDKLQKIKINHTTEQDILNILGEPTTKSIYGPKIYFYMERQYEQFGFFKPQLEEQRIIALEFDFMNIVKRVSIFNKNDAKKSEYESSGITIRGNKMSILEQLVRNIGQFNSKAQKAVH